MALQHNFSTQVSDLTGLKRIAKRMGYVQTRGPQKGEGSVRALLNAITRGEVALVAKERRDVSDAMRNLAAAGLVQLPTGKGKGRVVHRADVAGRPLSESIIEDRR
jgi:hypothetical protein